MGWWGSKQRRRHPLHQVVADKELLQLLSLPSTITLHPAGSDWYSLTTSAGLFSTRQSHLAPSGFDSCQSSYSSAITNSCSWQVTETHCWKGLGSVGVLLFQTFTFFPPCKHCSFLLSREWGEKKGCRRGSGTC